MTKIMFICHGNICRSTMAEFVMKDLLEQEGLSSLYHIESSATSREEIGNDIHIGTKQKLRQMGVPFESRGAVQIEKSDYDKFDYLVVMDNNNLRNIKRIIPNDPEGKISLLLEFAGEYKDIADPWYTGNFDETYDDVLKGCTALIRKTLKAKS